MIVINNEYSAYLYKIIDDFVNCSNFKECEDCMAFRKMEGVHDGGLGERIDYCRLLRIYKGMLTEQLCKTIEIL